MNADRDTTIRVVAMKSVLVRTLGAAVAMVYLFAAPLVDATEGLKLEAVDFATLAGNQLRIDLSLSGPAPRPAIFHTDNPARIALDLPGVVNGLAAKNIPIDIGMARSINTVESQGRTRVVLNLLSMAVYDVEEEGNHIYVTLHNEGAGAYPGKTSSNRVHADHGAGALLGQRLKKVDFMRGERGEGRILVSLSDANVIADMHREGSKVIALFPGVEIPEVLERKLDVVDFATPVRTVEIQREPGRGKITVASMGGDFEYSSYQTDSLLTIEFRPISKAELEERREKAGFTGDRLSLNFQDVPVRQVLQILSDFNECNMVASDTVQGNVTLRLNDVPWDQALDLVLKAKGLSKRIEGGGDISKCKEGNKAVIRIGPTEEIAKLEQQELEARNKVEELEPLKTELIPIKYARVADIVAVLKGSVASQEKSEMKATGVSGGGSEPITRGTTKNVSGDSILSSRGSVSMDDRTNTLLVKDTPTNLERIRQLVTQLDTPVRQVLIDSRVVIASDDFSRQLGVKFTTNRDKDGPNNNPTDPKKLPAPGSSQAFFNTLIDLAANNPQGKIGATILRAGGTLLDLELSAGQLDGRTDVLSSPRLLTSDGAKAIIKQGRQIPVTTVQASSAGTTVTVTYKDVVLLLEVTPHIAPDDNIMMDLRMTKDDQGEPLATAFTINFAVDKRELETRVQVRDGDTVVLGGVYEDTQLNQRDGIPFLSDVPGLGKLFQRNVTTNKKRELLVFVTPKIVRDTSTQLP